jgi:hypothetical protein
MRAAQAKHLRLDYAIIAKELGPALAKCFDEILKPPSPTSLSCPSDLLWAESLLKGELKKEGKDVKFFVPEVYEKSLKPLSEAARAILLRRESS